MLQIDISNMEEQELISWALSSISDFKNFEITIIFKADYSQSKMMRNLTLKLFEKNSISTPWNSRFALVADELINNSIEYGSLPLDKNIYKIKFSEIEGGLYINTEVHDTGKGFFAKKSSEMEEIRKQKEAEGFTNYLGKRGRGLFFLVKNVADKLYFKDKPEGGLIVGVEKNLQIA